MTRRDSDHISSNECQFLTVVWLKLALKADSKPLLRSGFNEISESEQPDILTQE